MNFENSKAILFAGLERGDIVEYVASIGSMEGYKVLVIDNSYMHDIFIAKDSDENNTETDRGAITYLKDVQYSEEMKKFYDFIFVYNGFTRCDLSEIKADITVVQTDASKHHLMKLRKDMVYFNNKYILIYRDRIGKKIVPADLASFIGKNPSEIAVIDYESVDTAAYIAFTIDGHMNTLRGASAGMQETVSYFLSTLYNLDAKTIKRRYL